MSDSKIEPKFTFGNFLTGTSNELAVAAAQSFFFAPESPHILFLHGPTGTGKTHLLHAIGNVVKDSARRVYFRPCEDFVKHAIYAFKMREIEEFQNGARNFDVLLLDDIQLLVGKPNTSREFSRILDARPDKWIAVSSNRSPSDLTGLDKRLVDRLREGLVVSIDKADRNLKESFLRKKAHQFQLDLAEEAVLPICQSYSTFREIEGTVKKLDLWRRVRPDRKLDLDGIKGIPGISIRLTRTTFEQIQSAVAVKFNVPVSALAQKNNSAPIVRPRQIAMYLAQKLIKLSSVEIGRRFDKHHTTVLHSIEKIEEDRKNDRRLDGILVELEDALANPASATQEQDREGYLKTPQSPAESRMWEAEATWPEK